MIMWLSLFCYLNMERTLLSPNIKPAQEWMLLKILQHSLLCVHDKFLQFLGDLVTIKEVMDVFLNRLVTLKYFKWQLLVCDESVTNN